MRHDPEKYKRNAIAFYRTAYLGDPEKAVELYVGTEYIQHNSLVGDGKAAFKVLVLRCRTIRHHGIRQRVIEFGMGRRHAKNKGDGSLSSVGGGGGTSGGPSRRV